MRAAVKLQPPAWDGTTLTLTLEAGEVGHAFPTGDMLRRLRLTVHVLDSSGIEVDRYERFLQRHFGFRHGATTAPQRVLLRDDRVGVNRRAVEVRFQPRVTPAAGQLRYQLTYERVVGPHNEQGRVPIDGPVQVASGQLPIAQ